MTDLGALLYGHRLIPLLQGGAVSARELAGITGAPVAAVRAALDALVEHGEARRAAQGYELIAVPPEHLIV